MAAQGGGCSQVKRVTSLYQRDWILQNAVFKVISQSFPTELEGARDISSEF